MLLDINFTNSEDVKELLAHYVANDRVFEVKAQVLLVVAYGILLIFGTTLNFFVIIIIVKRRSLWSSSTLLLVNLFVANIATCLLCIPFTLLSTLSKSWTFGKFLCKLVPFAQSVSVFVSAETVIVISCDRLLRIVRNRPVSESLHKRSSSFTYSIIIWIIASVLGLPVIVFRGLEVIEFEDLLSYAICVETWPMNIRLAYASVILLAVLIIPVACLTVSNLLIRKHLREHFSRNRTKLKEVYHRTEDLTAQESNRMMANYKSELSRSSRITCILMLGTVSYALSWLPLILFNLYMDLYDAEMSLSLETSRLIFSICHLIAMSSTISNAIIYGFMNTNINKEVLLIRKHLMETFSLPFFWSSTTANGQNPSVDAVNV